MISERLMCLHNMIVANYMIRNRTYLLNENHVMSKCKHIKILRLEVIRNNGEIDASCEKNNAG